jgi:hypothetical protein
LGLVQEQKQPKQSSRKAATAPKVDNKKQAHSNGAAEDQARLEKRKREAEAKRRRRQNETPDQRQRRLALHAERMRKARQQNK